ncbi:hypothetical protein SAMN05444920_1021023 [Nonomuraea solani]|uniref:Uncharacterized protein n=1 Tax=Nonomuraea solani TaxID=1144553 RepID=A0A1H6A474_9ACTN|nr:hypothetical protein SAMN05444920_1021023 [Nonomuraea solani]
MGRHAKRHNPKEQPQEPKEDSNGEEHHPSRGRHTKDRQRCAGESDRVPLGVGDLN